MLNFKNYFSNPKYTGRLIVFFSILIYGLFLILMSSAEITDSDYRKHYSKMADNILEGKKYLDEHDYVITRFPPGYAITLLPIHLFAKYLKFPTSTLIPFFNILIHSLCNFLLFRILLITTKDLRISLSGTFFWALFPLNWWLIKQANSETVYIFFVLAGILTLLRKSNFRYFFAGGLLLGFSALIRPTGTLLIVPVSIFLISKNFHNLSKLAANFFSVFSGIVVILFPWIIYVYLFNNKLIPVGGGSEIATFDGAKLSFYNPLFLTDSFSEKINLIKECLVTGKNYWFCLVDIFNDKPFALISFVLHKYLLGFFMTQVHKFDIYILILQIFTFTGISWGIHNVLRQKRISIQYVLLFFALFFYHSIVSVWIVPLVRYMVPAMPFLMVFLAYAFKPLADKLIWKDNIKNKVLNLQDKV